MSARVLVIDDEVLLAESLRSGLEAEGFSVAVAHDGEDGYFRTPQRALRCGDPGLDAARSGRPHGARRPAQPTHRGAGAAPHRPGLRGGPGRRPRNRGGRLPGQALRLPRAHRPHSRPAAAHGPGGQQRAPGSGPDRGRRTSHRRARRRSRGAHLHRAQDADRAAPAQGPHRQPRDARRGRLGGSGPRHAPGQRPGRAPVTPSKKSGSPVRKRLIETVRGVGFRILDVP